MIVLDQGRSLQILQRAVQASQAVDFHASYLQADQATDAREGLFPVDGFTDGILLNPVDVVSAPAASKVRIVKTVHATNRDTIEQSVWIFVLVGALRRTVAEATLQPGQTLIYREDGSVSVFPETAGSGGGAASDPGVAIGPGQQLEVVLGAAAATTAPTYVSSYLDVTSPEVRQGLTPSNGDTTGTTPVIVTPGPATGYRVAKSLTVNNPDTIAHTVTVQVREGAAVRVLVNQTLAPGASLVFTAEQTWEVIGASTTGGAAGADPGLQQGRLSVSPTDPVAEGSGADLFFIPAVGNQIAVYTGSAWVAREIPETPSTPLSVNAGGLSEVFDVYAYDNAGNLALELQSWGAGVLSRPGGAAIAQLNGVWLKATDNTRRLIGTVRTRAGNFDDVALYRNVCNVDNRVERVSNTVIPGAWSYSSPTFRVANNAPEARHQWVRALPSMPIFGRYQVFANPSSNNDQSLLTWALLPAVVGAVGAMQAVAIRFANGIAYDQATEYANALAPGAYELAVIESVTGGTYTYGSSGYVRTKGAA